MITDADRCTVPDCPEITGRMPFCRRHFIHLPSEIRDALTATRNLRLEHRFERSDDFQAAVDRGLAWFAAQEHA